MPAIYPGTAWNTLLVPGEKKLIKTGMAATGARGGATQEGSQRGMCGGTQPEERHRHWGPPGPLTCAYLAFCPAPPSPDENTIGMSIRSKWSDPLLHPMLAEQSSTTHPSHKATRARRRYLLIEVAARHESQDQTPKSQGHMRTQALTCASK